MTDTPAHAPAQPAAYTQRQSRGGAVVTGAGRGLGRQLAELLAARGHQVLVTDVDEELAQVAAEEIGRGAEALRVDVRDVEQVNAARDRILEMAGRLDVWINNAGVLFTGPAWQQAPEQRQLILDVNAIGTMNGTVAAIEAMRDTGGGKGRGHVVNIVSLAGLTAVPGETVYTASKHAAMGFSLGTLQDLRLGGIKDIDISCVCPDGIWTPMLYDKLDDPAAALSFSGKLLQPEEVVAVVSKVLDRPRPVTTIPGWRGALSRFGDTFPRAGLALIPFIVAQGRRTQRKLARRDLNGS